MSEQRIRNLCMDLFSTREPDEIEFIGEQLRSAIHEHVESLRSDLNALPLLEAIVA